MPSKDILNRMAFVEQLDREFCAKLSGDEQDRVYDIFDKNPEEKFYIGQLYPMQTSSERYATIHQIAVDFNVSASQLKTAKLKIYPQGSFFYRVFPTLEEQRKTVETGLNIDPNYNFEWRRDENKNYILPIAAVYERLKLDERFSFEVDLYDVFDAKANTGQLIISDEFDNRLDSCIDEIYKRDDIYRIVRNPVEMDYLKDTDSFNAFLSNQTDTLPMKPVWSLNLRIFLKKIAEDTVKVTVAMINNTYVSELDISVDKSKKTSKNLKSYSNRLFNANLKIELINAEIKPVALDYFINDYKHDRFQMAIGHNCSIAHSDGTTIQTTHIPHFIQKRLKTRDDLAVQFGDLISEPIATLRSISAVLRNELDDWREDFRRREASITNSEAKAQLQNEIANTLDEITRFEYGIDIIERYETVRESFVLMNKAFAGSSKGFESWRLFQIVFVASLIPDVVVQEYGEKEIEHNNLGSASVLFFPTGGGKTEAFLAVVVFSLFFDRLRGKSNGITAILKYPLRLLSAQQVSRVCDILAGAELIRRGVEAIKNTQPFAVGYFAGEINTPNKLTKSLMDEIDALHQTEVDTKYRLLDTCPFCKNEIHIRLNRVQIKLEHICVNPECGSGGVLPLHIVDREIYRYLPSVVISTLDKMAAIGYQSNFRNILGKVSKCCPQHGFTSKQECTEKELCTVDAAYFKDAVLYDTAPGLIICDEMHLSREALGTFASHYESVFQYMISSFSNNKHGNKRIKYIGASATISGYEEQMYHLFGKTSILFPASSPYVDKNLYSFIDHDEDNRTLAAIMPYGKASLNSLMYSLLYMKEILCKYKDNPRLMFDIPGMELSNESEALQILQDYWLILNYNNRKLDCNLVTGALDDPINIELNMLNRPLYEARKITGDDTFGAVKSLIQEIDGCSNMFELFNIIVSTSMISHGVDTSRFNNMFFFGVPSATAEYIQAYSRTGRIYPSFVFAVMRTKNEKDISNLKHFEGFHKYKNLMIDVVPIDRWAENAIIKTFPGVVSALIINHYDLELQKKYGGLCFMNSLQKAIKDGAIDKQELLNHLLMSFGCLEGDTQKLLVAKRFGEYITSRLDDLWNEIMDCKAEKTYITAGFTEIGFPVMNSLRDTEEALKVILS